MFKNISRFWIFYFFIYVFLALESFFTIIDSESPMRIYFQSLSVFAEYYVIPYTQYAMSVILNILAIIPLYLYIFKINFLSRNFWKLFLFVKIIFDVTGHMYEYNSWKALYVWEGNMAFFTGLSAVFLALPVYLALYRYSFAEKK